MKPDRKAIFWSKIVGQVKALHKSLSYLTPLLSFYPPSRALEIRSLDAVIIAAGEDVLQQVTKGLSAGSSW